MKFILLIITTLILCSPVSAWLSDYEYRMPIEINNTGDELTDFQYNFTVDTASLIYAGKMNANGSDCCITNSTDILQSFWNETAFNLSDTKIWVNGSLLCNMSNTTQYMYYGKPGVSSLVDGDNTFEFFDGFDGVNETDGFENIEEESLWSHASPEDWLGRPCLENYTTDNVWIATYIRGEGRAISGNQLLHIRFSEDEGETWTAEDTYTDGSAVGGFPISGHNSYSVGEALLIPAPNGDIIIQSIESNSFQAGSADMNGSWQWRSTDGGGNWTDEGQAFPKTTLNIADYVIVGSDIYITPSYDPSGDYTVPVHSQLYKSSDNGGNWSLVSNITTIIENPPNQGWCECAIEYCGNNTFLTVIRATTDVGGVLTMKRKSTDMGTTWGSLVDITSSVGDHRGRGQLFKMPGEPNRLYLTHRNQADTPEGIAIHYTDDWGDTWSSKFLLDTGASLSTDYVDIVKRTNGTYYAIYGGGTGNVSNIRKSIYQSIITYDINSSKWTSSGSPTIISGEVKLSDSDAIVSIDTFGFETIVTAMSKSNEQDSSFVGYYTDSNNRMAIENSDYLMNDYFDKFITIFTKGGANPSPYVQNDDWFDFRNTFYQYIIKRISTSSIEYSQGNNSNTYTNSAYIPIGDMSVKLYVWDSSQESTLTTDWIFIRKYAIPEPVVSLSAEESEITKPTIELISFTPTPLNTNYTGVTTISYMVESTNPLNLSSLAFLYGLNYTTTGDMHNYVATPPIDIASEGIYLAPNRNVTPYLSWEFNDTITGGNVWQWGGGDNNSWWIEKNQINATHTYINATGVTQHILPSSFYIQKLAMYNAPKTGFEINRQQGLIFKMWNVEEIRNRGHNYFANLYFDTSWESTLPNYPVEVGFCNYSYNPAVDDIDTCPDCTKFGEWDGNRWVNHSWVPGANASYAYPLVVNGSQYTEPTPTDINYIWLRSNTISSKSYILNATDYDPGTTNITFAETNTMWTYNELNGVTSPVAYTPSFFTTFVRNDEELLHHLYIADDTGVWGHSDIFSESIGISSVPVPPVSFEYFNVTCDESYHDSEMDATYDQGTVGVGMHCPADPDGTTVSHNLTLHYYPNMTLVAVINNTFTTTGPEDVEIEFTTTPYYSPDTLYTLKCVSTDGDDNVATKWLISYFALDADGNQGWVKDSMLLFWGINDIPTLYTEVNNNSLISYDGGSDIYTMHVQFFKSKGNDTFNFNETVHLESLNNEDVAFFRFMGRTNFDNANITGWNTTTDTAAPITDEYRAYVYSLTMTCGNITDSNFSYLGSDFYRQEGLNFVGNSYPYLIHNSTFSNNAEGPIFEECVDFTISNCIIGDNVNVGIGVYFSDGFIIENNTISSNGGRGIVMYEANNNTISYNDITDSGIHGVHYWSNSQNNTCTGNDISGSALYDYYLSSSSTWNYINDPASITDQIRVTSTSSVNIENTDNAVFTEDSLNTSYAYLTNFSMFVSSASQTFDITQRDMTIIPSNDNLSIQNFDWGNTIQFNAESSIGVNQTWINITNTRWENEQISIFVDELPYNISHADDNGTLDYNYSVSIGDDFFEFVLTIPPSPVPVSLYIFMGVLLFVFCGASFILTGIPSIFTSILSIMFSFIMSKIAVNGSLVQNIGGISSTGTVVQGVTIIEIPALSYILIFVGIFMTVILAVQVLREIKFRESQDIIELDL